MSIFAAFNACCCALLSLFEVPPSPGVPETPPAAPDDPAAPPVPAATPRILPRIHPRVLVGYGAAFGLVMFLGAYLWVVLIRAQSPAVWFPAEGWLADILIGLGVGSVFAGGAVIVENHVPSLKEIERMFLVMLDMRALRWHHALLLGMLAGFPEEILFRGAIQPEIGIIAASVIFGALHAATPAYFIYATTAGLLLGGLTLWRGGLWCAIAAHTMIDVIMFLLLIRTWRRTRNVPAATPPADAA